MVVNNKPLDEYFGRDVAKKMIVKQPLALTKTIEQFDFDIKVKGGVFWSSRSNKTSNIKSTC